MFAVSEATVNIRSENDFLPMCCQNTLVYTFMKNYVFGFLLFTQGGQWVVFRGKLLFMREGEWRKQTDRLTEDLLCIPATPCSVYVICVSDELWMRL